MPLDRKDPEVVALIEEVTAAATEALSAKNRELLGELKTLKAKAKGADIDPAEYAALQAQIEDMTDKLSKAEKSGKAEVEKLTKQLTEKDGALRKHLVDEGLTAAALKAGVATHYIDAVKALHGSRVQVEVKDGAYVATLEGKPLAESLTTWAQSDQGKHFVAAPANSGGGAGGGGGSPGAGTPKTLQEAKTPAERKAVIAARLAAAEKT
jgi:hypothetical protein